MTRPDIEQARASFIGQVNELRQMIGRPLSYELLAEKTGVSRSSVGRFLSGTGLKSSPGWEFFGLVLTFLLEQAAEVSLTRREVGDIDNWLEYWNQSRQGHWSPSPLGGERSLRRYRVLRETGVAKTLQIIYGRDLVNLWGVDMPIRAFPAKPEEWGNLEAAVGRLLDSRVPDHDEYDEAFHSGEGRTAFESSLRRFRKASELDRKHFFSGPTYALHAMDFNESGHLKIDFVMGRYFTSLATSERLDAEMMDALTASPTEPVGLDRLPQRRWLHDLVDDPVMDGRHRAAAVSHATVIAVANDQSIGGYSILLPPRSADVATHANFNHVAPSGIFAPFDERSPSPAQELSVTRNFYREWVEELYGLEHHQRPSYSLDLPNPEDEPEISRLKDLIQSGQGSLFYTGVTVNLLTMRPEICLLLLIKDANWLASESRTARNTGRPFKLGWEYAEGAWAGERIPGQSDQAQFAIDDDLLPKYGKRLDPTFLIPNAAGAISLALRVMREFG